MAGGASMKRLLAALLLLPLASGLASAASAPLTSVITRLGIDDCAVTNVDQEGGGPTQVCAGVAGYTLLVLDTDNRMSVTVRAPDNHEYPLDFPRVVTAHFSTVGERAEWRVVREGDKTRPVALIVGLDVFESPDDTKAMSYLIVVRLGDGACVIDKLEAGPGARARALAAADDAPHRTCLSH